MALFVNEQKVAMTNGRKGLAEQYRFGVMRKKYLLFT